MFNGIEVLDFISEFLDVRFASKTFNKSVSEIKVGSNESFNVLVQHQRVTLDESFAIRMDVEIDEKSDGRIRSQADLVIEEFTHDFELLFELFLFISLVTILFQCP